MVARDLKSLVVIPLISSCPEDRRTPLRSLCFLL